MAIQLYRKGDSHTVRGVTCEACNFDQSELDHQLESGWVCNEQDLIEKPAKKAAKKTEAKPAKKAAD